MLSELVTCPDDSIVTNWKCLWVHRPDSSCFGFYYGKCFYVSVGQKGDSCFFPRSAKDEK